jgi:hypothetical protein
MSITQQVTPNVLNGMLAAGWNGSRGIPGGDNELPSASPDNGITKPTFNVAETASNIPYGVGRNAGNDFFDRYWERCSPLYTTDLDTDTAMNFQFLVNYPPFKTLGGNLSDQKKVLKIFGVGNNFPDNETYVNDDNTRDYNANANLTRWMLPGMSTATVGTFPDANAWCRYDMTTYASIPNDATKVKFGGYIRIPEDDQLREKNVAGFFIRQTKQFNNYNLPDIYTNGIVVKNDSQSISFQTGTPIDSTDGSLANRTQWTGLQKWPTGSTWQYNYNDRSNVQSFDYHNASEFKQFKKVEKEITLQSKANPFLMLSCFFGENQTYLNNDGVASGSALFYDPFIIFE